MSSAVENRLARRLARMRWLAGALLAAMFALFVATSALEARHAAFAVLKAFAEAAMVGGLADWFAVTALFRHPLGLPIPHTAIVPRRKDAIGRALATFIHDHFLVRDAVEARLSHVDLAGKLGDWLARPANGRALSRDAAAALAWLMRPAQGGELGQAFRATLRPALEKVELSALLAAMLEVLTSGDHAQSLIDQLVRFGSEQLEKNKALIRSRVDESSPWWLPRFVDERIYDQLIAEFERILGEIGENPAHEARAEFNSRLQALALAVGTDPVLAAKGSALREEFLNHPALRRYLEDLWQRVSEYLQGALTDPQSALREGLAAQALAIGRALRADTVTRGALNGRLRELIIYLVDTYRSPLSETISATIERWDASATAERIELYLGRDLQFIRINGTVVGGLVGVLIYLLGSALPF
jgi:uncharacterized membrane-anchored protein YjiN (DUF445 family)